MSEISMDWVRVADAAGDAGGFLSSQQIARCLCDLRDRTTRGFETASRSVLDVEATTRELGEQVRKHQEEDEDVDGALRHLQDRTQNLLDRTPSKYEHEQLHKRVEHLENGKAAHLIRHRVITDLTGRLSSRIQILEQWRDAYPMTATEIRRKMSERIEPVTDTPHEQIMAKLDQIMEMAKNPLVGVAGWGKKFGDQSDEFWEGYKARDEEARGNL